MRFFIIVLIILAHCEGWGADFIPGTRFDSAVVQQTLTALRPLLRCNEDEPLNLQIITEPERDRIILVLPVPTITIGESLGEPMVPTDSSCLLDAQLQRLIHLRRDEWMRQIRENTSQFDAGQCEWIFTGKEHGGSLAEAFMFDLRRTTWDRLFPRRPLAPHQMKLITYFSRPAGNESFSRWMNENIGQANILRFTNFLCDKEENGYCFSGIPIHFSVLETPWAVLGSWWNRTTSVLPTDERLVQAWRHTRRNLDLEEEEVNLSQIGKFRTFSIRNPILGAIYDCL